VLKYWSQNEHLKIEFDVRRARPGDPAGMQQGTNIWGGVFDTNHHVTTELGTRSRGFVWFFSFLAWYSDIKRSPASFEGKEVSIKGTVRDVTKLPVVELKSYVIADSTGEITVSCSALDSRIVRAPDFCLSVFASRANA